LAHQAGKSEIAVETNRKAIDAIHPSRRITVIWARRFRAQGKLVRRPRAIGQALLLKPDYTEAHYQFRECASGAGQAGCGGRALPQGSVIASRELCRCAQNLGVALQDQGKLDAAIESYRKALLLQAGLY